MFSSAQVTLNSLVSLDDAFHRLPIRGRAGFATPICVHRRLALLGIESDQSNVGSRGFR